MTSKAKTTKAKKSPVTSKMTAKKPAKPKSTTVYTVVRRIPAESPVYTEPDRVFATKAAARRFAAECNRELRAVMNPFDCNDPGNAMIGGEKAFVALLKKLGLTPPTKKKGYVYLDWEGWWDTHYFDMTEDQRETLWDALTKYDWYKVKETTLED